MKNTLQFTTPPPPTPFQAKLLDAADNLNTMRKRLKEAGAILRALKALESITDRASIDTMKDDLLRALNDRL